MRPTPSFATAPRCGTDNRPRHSATERCLSDPQLLSDTDQTVRVYAIPPHPRANISHAPPAVRRLATCCTQGAKCGPTGSHARPGDHPRGAICARGGLCRGRLSRPAAPEGARRGSLDDLHASECPGVGGCRARRLSVGRRGSAAGVGRISWWTGRRTRLEVLGLFGVRWERGHLRLRGGK